MKVILEVSNYFLLPSLSTGGKVICHQAVQQEQQQIYNSLCVPF